jgi:hypothetical protein
LGNPRWLGWRGFFDFLALFYLPQGEDKTAPAIVTIRAIPAKV